MYPYCNYSYDPWSRRCRECTHPCRAESNRRADDRMYESARAAREYNDYCKQMEENWK